MAVHYESAGETQKSSRFTGTGCSLSKTLPKARLELARPCEHYDLNVACIPFHHFGATITAFFVTEESVPFRNVFVKPFLSRGLTRRFLGFTVQGVELGGGDRNVVGAEQGEHLPEVGQMGSP